MNYQTTRICWLLLGAVTATFVFHHVEPSTPTLSLASEASSLTGERQCSLTESVHLHARESGSALNTSTSMTSVRLRIVVFRAYSVHDDIDKEYHDARPPELRYLTASGTDASKVLHGIAGPKELQGARVFLCLHGSVPDYLEHYRGIESVLVDDTGGSLRRRNRGRSAIFGDLAPLHMELRFPTSLEARQFGVRTMMIRLDTSTR